MDRTRDFPPFLVFFFCWEEGGGVDNFHTCSHGGIISLQYFHFKTEMIPDFVRKKWGLIHSSVRRNLVEVRGLISWEAEEWIMKSFLAVAMFYFFHKGSWSHDLIKLDCSRQIRFSLFETHGMLRAACLYQQNERSMNFKVARGRKRTWVFVTIFRGQTTRSNASQRNQVKKN